MINTALIRMNASVILAPDLAYLIAHVLPSFSLVATLSLPLGCSNFELEPTVPDELLGEIPTTPTTSPLPDHTSLLSSHVRTCPCAPLARACSKSSATMTTSSAAICHFLWRVPQVSSDRPEPFH